MRFGIDYLGGANYRKVIRDNHPQDFGAGFILNTNKPYWPATDCWDVIEDLCKMGVPFIRVHAFWEDNHTYASNKHDKVVYSEFSRLIGLQAKYPKTVLYFSPFCERDNNSGQFDMLIFKLATSQQAIPIVNSVSKALYKTGPFINEFHGGKAPPKGSLAAGYSFDGDQCMDKNVAKVIKDKNGCQYLMFWASQDNGKYNAGHVDPRKADKTPRPLRKAWTYPELIHSFNAYRDWELVVDTIGPKRIWKTHADQHQAKRAPREGKPVLITADAGRFVNIVDGAGVTVSQMKRDDEDYADGSKRKIYRSSLFGYAIAEKALANSRSPIVTLIGQNGKTLGKVHPAFRAGSFR